MVLFRLFYRGGLATVLLCMMLISFATSTLADTYKVSYTNNGFSPKEIVIATEDTVQVTNNSTIELHVESHPSSPHPESNQFNIGLVEPLDGLGIMQFTKPGVHVMHNKYNLDHQAQIEVLETRPTPAPTIGTTTGTGTGTGTGTTEETTTRPNNTGPTIDPVMKIRTQYQLSRKEAVEQQLIPMTIKILVFSIIALLVVISVILFVIKLSSKSPKPVQKPGTKKQALQDLTLASRKATTIKTRDQAQSSTRTQKEAALHPYLINKQLKSTMSKLDTWKSTQKTEKKKN